MDFDAIVIGAGAAGMAAARRLARRSKRVVVLEARDRIGGRTWSQPLASTKKPVELGAEFIHGRAVETMALLGETGGSALEIEGDSWIAGENGLLQLEQTDFRSSPSLFGGVAALAEDETVDEYLQRFAGNASMREIVATARGFVEGFDAADPAIASVRSIAQEWRSGTDDVAARPSGGYAPIFERLYRDCLEAGVTFCLPSIVSRIAWRRGEVRVDAMDSGPRTIAARSAIVTLPIGVLRRGDVTFEPSLPASKLEALRSIEMGHVVKIALAFRTPFWERILSGRYRDAGFFRGPGQAFAAYWAQLPLRSNVITAWVGGPKAIALYDVSKNELVRIACDEFGALLGDSALARAEFAESASHDWSNDPFARGAYSYVVAGGDTARAVLGAPVDDTLYFAGEATSTDGQGGTVNGALESGERAATEAAA
jgi:monoamine oxidase